jgi:hypothetical protein
MAEQTTPKDPATGTRAAVRRQESRSNDKYSKDQHTYPSDLLSNQTTYGGNYVIFFINVAEGGKLDQSGAKTVSAADVPPREAGELHGKNYTKEGAVAGSAALGVVLGNVAGTSGVAAGGISAAGAAAIPTNGTLTRATKRLETAIALYMPNQVGIRYGMQWEEESMGNLIAMMEGGEALKNAVTGDLSKASNTVRSIAANLAISAGTPGAGAIARGGGVAANPRKEQVFKGVDYRSFQFNYQFYPKSSTEANQVMEIIHAFKYHMHPEFKDDKGFLYTYPSEFDIIYYNGGSENNNLHKHTSCVLKEMNVNYTPQGQFNAFADGTPMQINVDMTFLELALLTKDSIDKGM